MNCVAKHIELLPKSEILITSTENKVKIDESPKNVPLTQSLAAIDHVMTNPKQMSDTDTPKTSKSVSEIKSGEETNSHSQSPTISEFQATGQNYESKHLKDTINILTEDVVAVFDSCNISYRQSVRLTSAISQAIGVDLLDFVLNKSSFNEIRCNLRKKNG
ncbi:hypothetical protein KQX54_012904 [Cotesia glomerata]|uniref:Uncharacterized protein n=1 Tax=Cotesia glomerata TaxID=32391 RepID=A0AAV7HTU6_COTGL|nr:hypothetical protein KQX54_012904 [Cotesia glomerata]